MGYDADWFREALVDRAITPCIPGRKSRDKPIKYEERCYKRRNRIEIMFGCLKVFLSAIALAATVLLFLNQLLITIYRLSREKFCLGAARLKVLRFWQKGSSINKGNRSIVECLKFSRGL